MKLRFAHCEIDTDTFELTANGSAIKVEPKVFDLLAYLATNSGRIVSRDELIGAIWDGRAISDSAIDARVAAARRAIGDDGRRQAIIETVPRRGVRFVADVMPTTQSAPERGIDQPLISEQPSIAVLPFGKLSGRDELDGLADGICDDIIAALSRFRSFVVIARASTFNYRESPIDIRDVSRKLGARYVLEGSVRVLGERLRIAVQLVDAEVGGNVWTERYDRALGDLFEIQDDITQKVCAALDGAITLEELRKARLRRPENLDAWTTYHLGLHSVIEANRTADPALAQQRFLSALKQLERAQQLDPNFGRPYSLAAQVLRRQVLHVRIEGDAVKPALERALELSEKAISLDPQDGLHHVIRGTLLGVMGDWQAALQSIDVGVALNPNSALAYLERGLVKAFGLWPEEAIADLELATRLSPIDPMMNMRYPTGSWALLRLGDYEAAIDWGERGVRDLRSVFWPALNAAAGHAELGNATRAEDLVNEARHRHPALNINDLRLSMAYLADEECKAWYLDRLAHSGLPEKV